jgi:GAF domain-containing protein/HAMP domain-containing protein
MAANSSPQIELRSTEQTKVYSGIAAISGTVGFASLFLSIFFSFMAFQSANWQYFVLAAVFCPTFVLGLWGGLKAPQMKFGLRGLGYLSGSLAMGCLLAAIYLQDVGLPIAIIYLVFSLIMVATIAPLTRGGFTIIIGLIASTTIALAGVLTRGEQIVLPLAGVVIPGLIGVVVMVYITLLAVQFVSSPLQIRLTTSFLAVVIIPLAISSVIQSVIASNRLRSDTFASLSATADEIAITLDTFTAENAEMIASEARNPVFGDYLSRIDSNGSLPPTPEVQAALQLLETRESSERKFLSSYALLDRNGKNLFDTLQANIGADESGGDYFITPLKSNKEFFSNVSFDQSGNGFLYFSAPIRDAKRNVVGVLRSRYSVLVLQRLVSSFSQLVTIDSHAIVFDEYNIRLADDYQPNAVFSPLNEFQTMEAEELRRLGRLPDLTSQKAAYIPDLARVLSSKRSDNTAYIDMDTPDEDARGLPEMLAVSATRLQPWKVVYLKANFDQKQLDRQMARSSTLVASIMALLVGLASIFASRILSDPIIELTQTARAISSGNFEARAPYSGSDEYGTLGSAFNLMTDRLRRFISELESRVAQRTLELERRNKALTYQSTQLQTVAEVAREIVTAQELDTLLNSVTELISSRFGFYHVGIFLLDESHQFAVLRSANSEGGQHMLARKHTLAVGKTGIVGNVTFTGQPRIATDVGDDAVFFNNPDLPLTRSEMALPLKFGAEIIGALDVQSTEANAFSSDDITLFSTLADQVAVAIHNNRLYGDTMRALDEAQELHRQYLRKEWQAESSARKILAYRYTPASLSPENAIAIDLPDDESYQTGEPIRSVENLPDGTRKLVLDVPILLRGERIGAIRVQDQNPERDWGMDDVLAVRDVAQQVGVALENARLFERTMLRAERERKVLEITSRIRSVTDPQEMLEIAAAELQRALGATRASVTIRQSEEQSDFTLASPG